ncbi:1085_t:CDS:2, partial [Gigaspora rosea]
MIFEKLFQKYRKTEPKSLFVFKNFVLMLLLFALLGYTWLIIWGIYNDNPVIQHSLAEETSIPAPPAYFSLSQATNISCHFVNVSGTHDCKQYITLLNITNTDYGVLYTSFFMMEDLKFSTISNNGISSLEFKLYLNDTSYNLSDSFTLPSVTFSMDDADFMKSYDRNLILSTQLSTYSKLLETILRLNQYNPAAFN